MAFPPPYVYGSFFRLPDRKIRKMKQDDMKLPDYIMSKNGRTSKSFPAMVRSYGF
jgi:hypothetical protein